MKKIITIIGKILLLSVLFSLSICLSSCVSGDYEFGNEDIYVDEIEAFDRNASHFELNHYILPSEDFFDRFECTDVEYHFRILYESRFSVITTEKSVVAAVYEQDSYEQAKEFCLQEMELSESDIIEYNGYTFIENIELSVAQGRYGKLSGFPKWFNMFAYNDSKQCLVFMGIYIPKTGLPSAQEVMEDWGPFVTEYFSDVYSFEAE